MRFLPTAGVAVALLVVTAATLAAPPFEMKGPAAQTVAPPPGQKVVLREAALQAMLRDAANATNEEHERKLAELIAQLNVQKDKKKALEKDAQTELASQIAIKQGQAATLRRQADERRAALRAAIPTKPLQDLAIAQDKLIKELETGAAAIEGQIANLQSQYATAFATIDAEIKRLLLEIQKLQRDEDDAKDRQLAEIESQIQQAVDKLASKQTELLNSSNVLLAKPQRDAATKSASDELRRIKSIREGIAIGRTSKGSKVTPVGSSRSGG